MKKVIFLFAAALLTQLSLAQVGTEVGRIDMEFGDQSGGTTTGHTGILTMDPGTGMAIESYGSDKLITVGFSGKHVIVSRMYSDGSYDSTFDAGINSGGIVYDTIDGAGVYATCITVDKENNLIYIAGFTSASKAFILSLRANGTRNLNFGTQGVSIFDLGTGQNERFFAIGIQNIGANKGQLIVAGSTTNSSLIAVFPPIPLVLRYSATGVRDITFNSNQPTISGISNGAINDLDINSSDDIVLLSTPSNATAFHVVKLTSNGTLDIAFNPSATPKGIKDVAVSGVGGTAGDIAFQPGTTGNILVLVGQNNAAGGNTDYKLLRLRADGSNDLTFNNSNTPGYFQEVSTTYQDTPTNLEFDQYGRMIISGYTNLGNATIFSALRVNADGSPDYYFNIIGTSFILGQSLSSEITSDGRLMMFGTDGTNMKASKLYLKDFHPYYFQPIPTKYLGSDPFFLSSYDDKYPVNFSIENPAKAKVEGRKVTVRDTGSTFIRAAIPADTFFYFTIKTTPLTVEATPPAIILGQSSVPEGEAKALTFVIRPDTLFGYWSLEEFFPQDDNPRYDIDEPNSPTTDILFKRGFKGGVLKYMFFDGTQNTFVIEKTILADPNYTEPENLDTLSCTQELASCAGNFINYFRINTLTNDSSSCGMGGYSDFTQSKITTSLSLGEPYTATLRINSPVNQSRFVAIWLDHNNDGKFSEEDFLGADFSTNKEIRIPRLLVKNDPSYAGARRLRVRCIANGVFSESNACPAAGESGETEDYLVTLQKKEDLQGPNVITPNEDGKNDYFVIRGLDGQKSKKLIVFDRMGHVKFEQENYTNDWDGKDEDGELLNKGTYYYIFTNGNNQVKGFFELLY